MDEEERSHYLETRDVRYNCAGYFTGLWEGEKDVRTLWTEDGTAAEFLEMLILSEREQGEGTVGDKLYSAMGDKLEARVQMGNLLAKICRDSDTRVQEIDLGTFFLKIAAHEMGNTPGASLAQFTDWRQGTAPRIALHLPEPRAPNDDWVKRAALSGLQIIGYEVTILEDQSALIERTPADE